MKKFIPFLIIIAFILSGCSGTPEQGEIIEETIIEEDINTFVSPNHGSIAIFPTFKYLGSKESSTVKSIRKYHVWEQKNEGKYVMILQIVPKEGTFPENLNWTPEEGALFIKGKRAAYSTISFTAQKIMFDLGADFPLCFVLAEEVHVVPTEAVFRILIVPDRCEGNYEPVMEELDRVAIIKPLG